MKKWIKKINFESTEKNFFETWLYEFNDEVIKQFDVHVNIGKEINIVKHKKGIAPTDINKLAEFASARKNIFSNDTLLQVVSVCPICGFDSSNSEQVLEIYGAKYVYCKECHHCYVLKRPTEEALFGYYSTDLKYHTSYVDRELLKRRIDEIAVPKLKWVLNEFKRLYGRYPEKILDIGAGGGHFVEACRQYGIKCDGVEINDQCIEFCKCNFGFELINMDFLENYAQFKDYDCITLWGVIEHIPNPLQVLKAAKKSLNKKESLIISEVPKWTSLSTAIQSSLNHSVMRHLDPLGHIHCFTDSSLATAYAESGIDIVSAWYFGLDAYELLSQLASNANLGGDIDFGSLINIMQSCIDRHRLSDEIVLAGRPQ